MVGFNCSGKIKDICERLKIEASINSGVTVEEYARRLRVAKVVIAESRQFGEYIGAYIYEKGNK